MNEVFDLWYSTQMAEMLVKLGDHVKVGRTEDGKLVRYTCMSRLGAEHGCKWQDLQLVGRGDFVGFGHG